MDTCTVYFLNACEDMFSSSSLGVEPVPGIDRQDAHILYISFMFQWLESDRGVFTVHCYTRCR